ncbi:MAG: CoA transferase [Acidimicrobiales bacterium]|jgi:crotonobetainyl-CoA:carnitine CoA-transferase CaiB-like acyl-CoA transferase
MSPDEVRTDATTAPLDGVRVVELGDESAEYCGRLLAGLGADVVKAEPPGGAPSRSVGPFVDDRPGPDRSLAFWADNVGKRSVVVHDDDEVLALVAAADVVVHTLRASECEARRLTFTDLRAVAPGLIVCALTPFGHDGPWADYLADDLVLMALGGSMAACGYGPGADGVYDTPPLASHGDQAWRTAATYGAIAVLGALAWRQGSGQGQFLDVSAHECSASMTEWHLMTYLCSGAVHRRGPHPTLTGSDGRQVAALNPDFLGPHVFARMLEMLEAQGVAGPLSDPAFADPAHRAANYREVWRALKRLAEKHDGETLYRLGQSAGLPWGVIRSPDEVLDDRHLRARGHFVELEHPELGRTVTYPGAPFLAHASPWVTRRRPPLLDEHADEVARQWHPHGAAASDGAGSP